MIIEIQYKDKSNWESVSGKQIDWTNYSKIFKKSNVQPFFIQPEVIQDVWNGKTFDIQHVLWDAYSFQLYIRESEIKFLQQLKSCSQINIIQYEKNSSGTIIYNSFEDIDLIKTDFLTISEPERIDQTTAYKVTIIFRTNRTILNKALPVDNTNYIQFGETNALYKVDDKIYSESSKIFRLADNYIIDSSASGIQKYSYSSSLGFQTIGNRSIIGPYASELVGITENRVAAIDFDGNLLTMDFDGTDWSQIGNSLAVAGSEDTVGIALMTSSQIAISSDSGNYLRSYSFDGTDWSLNGNSFSLGTITNPRVTYYDSNTVAYIDETNSELRLYDFDGTDWSLSSEVAATAISLTGSPNISLYGGNSLILIDDSKVLRYYTNNPAGWIESSTLSVNSITNSYILKLNSTTLTLLETDYISNFSFGLEKFYSDYDILDWNKLTESLYVDWYDGSRKLAKTVNIDGFEYLQYVLTSDYDRFIGNLKQTNLININGVTLSDPEFEPSLIAENIWKVIVRGVKSVVNTSFDLNTNSTYNITIDGTPYYTDYKPEQIDESPNIDPVENQTGINTSTKTITKVVKQYKFFLNETNAFALKAAFETRGTTKTADSVAILEERAVSPNKLGYDLYEVNVNCLISVTDA